ncbi:MAG: FkbM family methyltransferase [Acidimicrobiia bacterium]
MSDLLPGGRPAIEPVPPDVPPPPFPAQPLVPIVDLSHRPPDRQPDWSIIPDWLSARVAATVACTDADLLPRVEGAGDVIERDGERLQVMHNGVLVTEGGYYGVLSSEIIRCLRGVHEPQEEVAYDAILRRLATTSPAHRAPVMVELGAYWAYYALWFLDSFPDGHAICLEPDPRNMAVGEHNFTLNGRSGTFLHAAIGDGSGATMPFHPDDGAPPIDLPTHDLRSLLGLLDEPAIDVLLADIQGGEHPLLAHSLDVLRSGKIRFVVVSTHDLSLTGSAMTHQHVLALLVEAGAHIICEHSVTESVSGDGVVVASFDPRDRDLVVEVTHGRACLSLSGEWEPRLEDYRARLQDTRRRLDDTSAELAEVRAQLSAAEEHLARLRRALPLRIRRAVLRRLPSRGRRGRRGPRVSES